MEANHSTLVGRVSLTAHNHGGKAESKANGVTPEKNRAQVLLHVAKCRSNFEMAFGSDGKRKDRIQRERGRNGVGYIH